MQRIEKAELPELEIIENDGGVQVTLFKDSIDGSQDGSQVSNLTTRQKEVFELIVANPKNI